MENFMPVFRVLCLGLLLVGLLNICTSVLAAPSPATSAPAPNSPADPQSRPLGDLLNADGTLNLRSGYSGALDPTGWDLTPAKGDPPRFVPKAPVVAGDENWDTRFAAHGPDYSVLA